jgi:hypothetical protein
MAENPRNAVMFLLDRTGSMESIKATTIESFNAYLAELRERPEIEFSLLQFDSTSTDTVHFRAPVGEVPGDADRAGIMASKTMSYTVSHKF